MLGNGAAAALAALIGISIAAAGVATPDTAHLDEAAPHAVARPAADDPLRFVLAPTGNAARYRVREQLAGFDFPNDAVGATSDITGAIVLGADGKVVRGESKFVVDLTKLKSDRERRDGYLQRRTLETEKYPTVELVPTELRGLPIPLPTSGERTFDLLGDLTIRGTTRPTTWRVTATFDRGRIAGSAATAFTFADFEIAQPKVASVLSVSDTIRLEYDFVLEKNQ
jgi:polyisoprenoid-binding protein YceI